MASGGADATIDSGSDVEAVPSWDVDIAAELQDEPKVSNDPDPDQLPRDFHKFPPLYPPQQAGLSEARTRAAVKIRQDKEKEAAAALATKEWNKAIDLYSEAMRVGGTTAMILATRGTVLLSLKRPCAAIRDCTAALKVNASLVKAYRIRGAAHRKLGHWKKAHRDLSEAQGLKFDADTAELHKLVATRLGIPLSSVSREAFEKAAAAAAASASTPPKGRAEPAPEQRAARAPPPEPEIPPPAPPPAYPGPKLEDLEKGQAVIVTSLKNASHLNGRRGVVERCDPRPSARGRWEVELRLDFGRTEIKSLKRENIETVHKLDKAACKHWAAEEKKHKEFRREREKREEEAQYRRCVEKKLEEMPRLDQSTRSLVVELEPKDALALIDKAASEGSGDLNTWLTAEARKLRTLGHSAAVRGAPGEPASKRSKTAT